MFPIEFIICFPSVFFARFLALAMAFMMLTGTLCKPACASDDLLDGFEDTPSASGDSLLDGFEESDINKNSEIQYSPIKNSTTEDLPTRLGGHIKTTFSYNFAHDAPVRGKTNWQGVSRSQIETLLELEAKPVDSWLFFISGLASHDFMFRIRGRENYTDSVLDAYETEVEMREVYLQGSPANQMDIKIGRQIVVWGTSDYVRVVDILNPLDLRDPGITDIEDLRLPVAMSKLDYYWGDFNLSGMIIHEVRFNEIAPYGSAFYPYPDPPPQEEEPDSNLKNTQFALALKGVFSGWDLGIYYANIYHPETHIETALNGITPVFVQRHERVKMFGGSSTLVAGDWIIKGETAYWNGLKFTNVPHQSFAKLDVMVGFEYSGFNDTRITLELVNQHIFDYESGLKNYPDTLDENQLQSVFCVERDFMNEALTLTLLATAYGEKWQSGSYQRISAEYEIIDNLTVKGGVIFYQSGNLPMFNDIGGNDKAFVELKYSF